MSKTLPVSAIKNGTVIDHIRPGQAPRIMHLLNVLQSKNKVTMGLNLPSKLLKLKDLLKIEKSFFHIEDQGKQIKLLCHYCEKMFDRDQVKVNI